jgi:hypothetical protein
MSQAPQPEKDTDQVERTPLSERDTKLWLDLIKNPPKLNERLIEAARSRQLDR